jgi:hypothetical protein
MRESVPIERSPFILSGLWSHFRYHFHYGDTPPPGHDYTAENLRLSGFACPVHPDPLKEAISSARNLRRCLLVAGYCVDNPESVAMDSVFQSAPIGQRISTKFVLCTTSATAADSWTNVTGTKFAALPLFLFLRGPAETLPKCEIFVSHASAVSADILM